MKKRSVTIAGHKTSVTLEDRFWFLLKQAAAQQNMSLHTLIAEVDQTRDDGTNLSSALRLYILNYLEEIHR